jgi:hypothetical protein|tara:strand:- start:3118 stop:3570 length:453 start_codon:yes stop_codon:yes gene_type:complete
MANERLDLRKEVFNKAQYIKTIDTSFGEIGVETLTEELQVQPSLQEFFGLYNSLFYDIPALGETNSHQFLVRTSGEYINFEEINGEVLALQAEIAQLRQDLLNAQMNNIKASSEGLGSEQTNEALDIFQKELNIASSQIVDTATDSISTT